MDDKRWLAASSGDGINMAEQYIAEAHALQEPIPAIDRYLLAIDAMQSHIEQMDTAQARGREKSDGDSSAKLSQG